MSNNSKVYINSEWKSISDMYISIDGIWRGVSNANISIDNLWKSFWMSDYNDVSEVARWNFEDGFLTIDSVGNNTLTSYGDPVVNTSDYKQGTGSVDFESSTGPNFYRILDSNLSSNFPFKNGNNSYTISICCWIKPESFSETAYLVSKFDTSKRQFALQIRTNGELRFYVSSSDQTLDYGAFPTYLTADRWYHIGVAYNGNDGSLKIRIWDDVSQSLLAANLNDTLTTIPYDSDSALHISTRSLGDGGSENYDGLLDKLSIFSKFLSDDEIDSHRIGNEG